MEKEGFKMRKKLSPEAADVWADLPKSMKLKLGQAKSKYSRNKVIFELMEMGLRAEVIAEFIGISSSQIYKVYQARREEEPSEKEAISVVRELELLKSIVQNLSEAFQHNVDLAIKNIVAQKYLYERRKEEISKRRQKQKGGEADSKAARGLDINS
jgi:Glu-tRNA(Gln) amidotransferase subunit E-like FAD-binding protein